MKSAILENKENGRNICMMHGHQADFFNSVCWKLSRFLVRYLWKPLEKNGFNDPTSAARNNKKAQKYEKCLKDWTAKMIRISLPGIPTDQGFMMKTTFI